MLISLLYAQLSDFELVFQNESLCAPGTEQYIIAGTEICVPLNCSSVSESCTTCSFSHLPRCEECKEIDYLPKEQKFGPCMYKCKRTTQMLDCYFDEFYYCYGEIVTETDSFLDYCQVCQNGEIPTSDAMNCETEISEDKLIPNCLSYSDESICEDCGVLNCSECTDAGQCKTCVKGYHLFRGQCIEETANCLKPSNLSCSQCDIGYRLFESGGISTCSLLDSKCEQIATQDEICVREPENISSMYCEGIDGDGSCASCDCGHLREICSEYCGYCRAGQVYANNHSCVTAIYTIKNCVDQELDQCKRCKDNYNLHENNCEPERLYCSGSTELSSGIACVCKAYHTRDEEMDCVLKSDACVHGVLVGGECRCVRHFTGELCTRCEGAYVLYGGRCQGYHEYYLAFWALFGVWWVVVVVLLIIFRKRLVARKKDKKQVKMDNDAGNSVNSVEQKAQIVRQQDKKRQKEYDMRLVY